MIIKLLFLSIHVILRLNSDGEINFVLTFHHHPHILKLVFIDIKYNK